MTLIKEVNSMLDNTKNVKYEHCYSDKKPSIKQSGRWDIGHNNYYIYRSTDK